MTVKERAHTPSLVILREDSSTCEDTRTEIVRRRGNLTISRRPLPAKATVMQKDAFFISLF
ncbi:unnamed protein product, partial [Ectocarpus sp. 13 AM-2016]